MKYIVLILTVVALIHDVTYAERCARTTSEAVRFYGTLQPFSADGKYGYRFPRGKIVVPASFDDARPLFTLKKGWQSLRVKLGDGERNEEFLPTAFHIAPVRTGGRWHIIRINTCDEHEVSAIGVSDGFFPCELVLGAENPQGFVTKTGYLNLEGNFIDMGSVLGKKVNDPQPFFEGLAFVTVDDSTRPWRYSTAIIDVDMKITGELKHGPAERYIVHAPVRPFREGRAMFRASNVKSCVKETREDVFGFIDRTGKIVIEPDYLKAESFHRGLARVSYSEKKYGVINSCYASCCWYGMMPFFLVTRRMPARACHDEVNKIIKDDTVTMHGVIDVDGKILHHSIDPAEVELYINRQHPVRSGEGGMPAE